MLACLANQQTTPFDRSIPITDGLLVRVAEGSLRPTVEDSSHPLHDLVRQSCRLAPEERPAAAAVAETLGAAISTQLAEESEVRGAALPGRAAEGGVAEQAAEHP